MDAARNIKRRFQRKKFTYAVQCTCLFCFVAPSFGYAAGFSNFTQGAGPVGAANATVAHHEGVSSVFYNPALQMDFTGLNAGAGLTFIWPKKKLDSAITGQTYESDSKTYTPLHLATTYRLSDIVSLAFTVNNSFGLGSSFPEDTIFRYITTESQLTTWDMNPSVAFQVHKDLAIGVGLRAVKTDVALKQMIPLQSFGLADGTQEFEADGTGYGWNIGAAYSITEDWSLGASYRSPVDVDLSGDVSFELPQNSSPVLSAIFPATSAQSGVELPGQLFLGVAYKPSPQWVIEAATRFEQYSSYDKLVVTTQSPVAGKTSNTINKDWSDVWGYMLGVSYQTESGYRVSGGYLFEENPIPDASFEPGVSGLDKHTLTIGLAKRFGNFAARVAFAHDIYEDREINNSGKLSVLNGTYSQKNEMLAFTLEYRL